MDKEEILQRSRAEQTDEGEIHAQKTGRSWGFLAMTVMYLAIVLATILFGGRYYTLAPIHAIYFTGLGMQFIGYAKTSSQKSVFFSGVFVLVFGIVFFVLYVMDLQA